MKQKLHKGIVIFICLNMVMSLMAGGIVIKNHMGETEYLLYIGLNDQDTYEQIISTKEAKERMNAVCAKYVDGYTLVPAEGGWIDENGVLTQENTLIYHFKGIKEEQVNAMMDEILKELNQNSILMEERKSLYKFYSGGRK